MKLVYESLKEAVGFKRGLDPKTAMNIGILTQIHNWIKELNSWQWRKDYYRFDDINQVLRTCIDYDAPNKYIEYLINNYNKTDYNLNDILEVCIRKDKYEFFDLLISKGAKFTKLSSKAKYITNGGTLISLTREEKLMIACKYGDFPEFKK